MLLILTSKHDLAVDYLITSLLDRGLRYFRLNCEDLSGCKVHVFEKWRRYSASNYDGTTHN